MNPGRIWLALGLIIWSLKSRETESQVTNLHKSDKQANQSSKFFIGNRFHITPRIVSPENIIQIESNWISAHCAEACKKIIEAAMGPDSECQIGKTKIFLKDSHDSILESARERAIRLWVYVCW